MNERLMRSPTTRPRCSAETQTGTRCKRLVAWGNQQPSGWRGYCGRHFPPVSEAVWSSLAWSYLPADAQDAIKGRAVSHRVQAAKRQRMTAIGKPWWICHFCGRGIVAIRRDHGRVLVEPKWRHERRDTAAEQGAAG